MPHIAGIQAFTEKTQLVNKEIGIHNSQEEIAYRNPKPNPNPKPPLLFIISYTHTPKPPKA